MEESWQYIALLGAVIVVFAFILPKQSKQSSINKSSKDELEKMEFALGQFMENMEQQHDELVNVLTSNINQLKDDNRQKSEQLSALEKKYAVLEEQISTLSHAYVALETKYQFVTQSANSASQLASEQINVDTTEQVESHEPDPNSIHMRYSELFELYDAGKSIEFIAKKLGKNKGEVQLIIQLAKQEEKIQRG